MCELAPCLPSGEEEGVQEGRVEIGRRRRSRLGQEGAAAGAEICIETGCRSRLQSPSVRQVKGCRGRQIPSRRICSGSARIHRYALGSRIQGRFGPVRSSRGSRRRPGPGGRRPGGGLLVAGGEQPGPRRERPPPRPQRERKRKKRDAWRQPSRQANPDSGDGSTCHRMHR